MRFSCEPDKKPVAMGWRRQKKTCKHCLKMHDLENRLFFAFIPLLCLVVVNFFLTFKMATVVGREEREQDKEIYIEPYR